MRSDSTIQSCPTGSFSLKTINNRFNNANVAGLSCDFGRRIRIPAYSFGGYARMFPKSLSSVSRTRPWSRITCARCRSSDPVSPSSSTVSARKPAARITSAASAGRFSSTLNFTHQLHEEDLQSPLSSTLRRRLTLRRCPRGVERGSWPESRPVQHQQPRCQGLLKPSPECLECRPCRDRYPDLRRSARASCPFSLLYELTEPYASLVVR